MTTSHLDSDYPVPDNSHLLSEIGYASLPPPPNTGRDHVASEHLAPPQNASPTLHDRSPRHTSPIEDAPHHDSPHHDAQLSERFAPQWIDLLRRAVEEPGLISEAYTRFHGYSLGNRFAALLQCQMRGLEPGPLNTFHGWRKLGYAVQEGEKALTLCMPLKGVLAREKPIAEAEQAGRSDPLPDIEEIEYIRAFVWKPHWFVLAQTQPMDPDNVQPVPTPALGVWDKAAAMTALNIRELPFQHLDGNTQGYAQGRGVAVSPLAAFPYKTLFHEMAHVVLGHTDRESENDPLIDTPTLPRSVLEVEAEGVALLLLDTFDLPGQEYARGYIQHWLQGEAIPEKSAQRIFGGADRILSAGLGEGRTRFPTAEDLGWPESTSTLEAGTQPERGSEATNGTEGVNGTVPTNGALPSNGTARPATAPQQASEEETHALAPSALPASAIQNPRAVALAEALLPSEGEAHAWKLHGRLQHLHGQLHPEDRAERGSLQRALAYLQRVDPTTAHEVQELVTGASRSLKAAFGRLERALEPLEDEDVFAEDEDLAAAHDAQAEAATPTLTPTQEAAARRMVGRDLRQELQSEKKRFFETAKEHGLKVGGKHEKAMLKALSEFLGEPIESRRTPSSRQWAQAASAIATEDLLW